MNCTWGSNCTSYSTEQETQLLDNATISDDGIQLYDVPGGVIALLSVFYGTISVLAVVGNSLVMWIVATSRRMQNVTNCFIANLALADIVIGLFAIPFQFQAALLQRWSLPEFMCAFCPFVQVLSVNVSVFTLTAIAVDRHRAILNPLSARPSKLRARLLIAGIWCIAAMLAAPMAVALRVEIVPEEDTIGSPLKPFCRNVHLTNEQMMLYRLVLVVLQYLVPLCVISCVYARMALRLWGSKTPGNAQDSRDANLMKNKKKVIKMLVIVVALFALCWMPLQTYNIVQDIFPAVNRYKYINIIWFCCDWLAMSNSCYNPFIYGIYNEKFKREFKARFPFRHRHWSPSGQTDSVDLTCQSRASIRGSLYHNNYDWRRTYSSNGRVDHEVRPINGHHHHHHQGQHNNFYRGVSVRGGVGGVGVGGGGGVGGGPIRRYQNNNENNGVNTELFVFPVASQKASNNMDELCL